MALQTRAAALAVTALALFFYATPAGRQTPPPTPGLPGIVDDGLSHPPPATGPLAYNAFVPPSLGGASYIDPVFGTRVIRMSADQSADDSYARNMWWSADGKRYLHRNYGSTAFSDFWDVIEVATGAVTHKGIRIGSSAADAGFDPVDPDVLYKFSSNKILQERLNPDGTWTESTYFTAPANVQGLGGSLNWLSADGKYMVVRYGPEPSVYVYNRQDLAAGPYTNPIDSTAYIGGGSYIALSPSGQNLVGYTGSGGTGGMGEAVSWRLDHVARTVAVAPTRFWSLCGDHATVISPSDGRDYMVVSNCNNQTELWRVDVTNDAAGLTETQQRLLPNNLRLIRWPDWGSDLHLSAAARGPMRDWVFVSTERNDPFNGGVADANGFITPWSAYRQEIIGFNVMTGEIRRLAHHRSRSLDSEYDYSPRVSTSWGAEYVGWNSNFNQDHMVDAYAIRFAPVAADDVSSIIAITDPAPMNGSTLAGPVHVAASAAPSVLAVQFFANGVALAPEVPVPFELTWDTTTVADKTHALTAVARDTAGTLTTSAPVMVAVLNGLPAAISNVTISSITGTTAIVTWTTDIAADSRVDYGKTTYNNRTGAGPLGTTHSRTLTGLTGNTLYHLRARSKTASNRLTVSSDYTFTTLPTPPTISGRTATAITQMSATITWTTNEPATSQVDYGLTTAYGQSTTLDPAMVTAHAQPIAGLTLNTTYNYRVRSTNALGLTAVSNNSTFKTLATPAAIGNVAASPVDITTAVITWTTDLPADTQIEYGLTSAYGTLTTLNTSLVTSHLQALSALTANTEYHFRARSKAAGAAVTVSPDATFTTLPNSAPAVISSVLSSNVTATGAAIAWLTDLAADTQVEYGTTTVYGNLTTLNTALVTSHLQTLSALTTNTEYHFRVRSKASGAAVTVSPDVTFTTLMSAPVVTLATATAITTTSATITWTTDQPADSLVDLGPTSDYGTTASDATPVLSHTQTLSSLTPATTYHYRVTSKNAQNSTGSSVDLTFTTAAVPAVISSVSSSNVTANSATIAWLTDLAADTQVEYGTTTDYGNLSALDSALVTSHQQTLSGLAANTAYHFRVRSRTGAGALTLSDDATFTTLMNAPIVTLATASAITTTSATITWTTDQPTDSLVELGPATTYGTSLSDGTPVLWHSQALSGLTPSTTYHYRVTSRNAQGTPGSSVDLTFTTAAVPAVISGVSSSNVTTNSATIAWLTDLAADTQVEYGLTTTYGSTTALNTALVTSHSQALSGLAANTLYHFRVRSRTGQGALSLSGDATFTTMMTAPVVTLTTATAITSTSASITWTTDQPSDSRVDAGLSTTYGTTVTDATLVVAHAKTLTGLSPSTLYHYRVTSKNSQGTAGSSVDLTFTTAPLTAVISGVSASNITTTSARIAWLTDLATDTQVEYGTTTSYGTQTTRVTTLVTSHSQTISSLTSGTLYHYRVKSRTAAGVTTTSADFTFTTTATAPQLSNIRTTSVTRTTATIAWTTNQPATTQVEYGLSTSYGNTTPLNSSLLTSHSVSLSGLTPNRTYNYRVRSTNAQGITTVSGNFTFRTQSNGG